MVVVQQLAPWVSLLASLFTFGYVVLQEWRQYTESTADSGRSLGRFLARLDTFVYTAVAMLCLAGAVHYLLTFTPFTVLAVPVWLLAVFVVLATGATQAMPGEDFEDKLQRADRELRTESGAAGQSGDTPDEQPVRRGRESQDGVDE
jgi:hypothetical protein